MACGVHLGLCGVARERPDGRLGHLSECCKDLVDLESHACAGLDGFYGVLHHVVDEVMGSMCAVGGPGVELN